MSSIQATRVNVYFFDDKELQTSLEEKGPIDSEPSLRIDYFSKKHLARTDFTSVKQVENKFDRKDYCLKIPLRGKDAEIYNEAAILQILNQADPDKEFHIIELSALLYKDGSPLLVFPYFPLSDLRKFINNQRTGFPAEKSLYIIKQVLEALQFLKENEIIHRDIKPSNIFILNEQLDIKIADFGFAILKGQYNENKSAGTLTYLSPERICLKENGYESDIWATGCVGAELYIGKVLFDPVQFKSKIILGVVYMHQARFKSQYPSIFFNQLHALIQKESEKAIYNQKILSFNQIFEDAAAQKLEKTTYRDKLLRILKKMLIFEPKERGSSEDLLEEIKPELSSSADAADQDPVCLCAIS